VWSSGGTLAGECRDHAERSGDRGRRPGFEGLALARFFGTKRQSGFCV